MRLIERGLVAGCLVALSLHAGCASSARTESSGSLTDSDPEFALLVAWMTGSFSSQAQSERDDEYFDIRLRMVRIWPDRTDGSVWLYVEQATAQAIGRPYRQRVYRLASIDTGEYESAVFELPGDPLAFAGWWSEPERFDVVEPAHLTQLSGCSVFLRYEPGSARFVGSTLDGTCPSSVRGASYVMSEVVLTADLLATWDRGFDSSGTQVWGAVSGGYEFERVD